MLNLNEEMPKDDEIKFGEDTFIVTCDIPYNIIAEIKKLNLTDATKEEENQDKMRDITKQILSIKNDVAKINSFVDGLKTVSFFKVWMFINEYIQGAITDSVKKKELKTSSIN